MRVIPLEAASFSLGLAAERTISLIDDLWPSGASLCQHQETNQQHLAAKQRNGCMFGFRLSLSTAYSVV